jgi:hypothetical protein
MPDDRLLTLHFNDGSKLAFDFPEQAMNAAGREIMLAELMKSQHVIITTADNVLIFPINNIKYIALAAPRSSAEAPLDLPKHAIRGARLRN